ncbi:hypothetical protein D3C86_2056110 [compost metagenome]
MAEYEFTRCWEMGNPNASQYGSKFRNAANWDTEQGGFVGDAKNVVRNTIKIIGIIRRGADEKEIVILI